MARINTTLFNVTIAAALLLAPLGSAAAATSITRTVKVTKTVTVRTMTTRRIVRTVSHRTLHRHVYGARIYRARTVVFIRRFHPESCFLTPVQVVALDALGPYCDSPRGRRRIVLRY